LGAKEKHDGPAYTASADYRLNTVQALDVLPDTGDIYWEIDSEELDKPMKSTFTSKQFLEEILRPMEGSRRRYFMEKFDVEAYDRLDKTEIILEKQYRFVPEADLPVFENHEIDLGYGYNSANIMSGEVDLKIKAEIEKDPKKVLD